MGKFMSKLQCNVWRPQNQFGRGVSVTSKSWDLKRPNISRGLPSRSSASWLGRRSCCAVTASRDSRTKIGAAWLFLRPWTTKRENKGWPFNGETDLLRQDIKTEIDWCGWGEKSSWLSASRKASLAGAGWVTITSKNSLDSGRAYKENKTGCNRGVLREALEHRCGRPQRPLEGGPWSGKVRLRALLRLLVWATAPDILTFRIVNAMLWIRPSPPPAFEPDPSPTPRLTQYTQLTVLKPKVKKT